MMQKNSSGSFHGEPGLFGVRCCFCFCAAGINDDHPTSENGKIVVLTSGRPAFQKHAKHTEGSDTTLLSHVQKALSTGRTGRNFGRSKKITQPSGAATPAEQRRA